MATKVKNPVYPFNAIINQEKTKTALILNAINPEIGGALISGPKGTGKSLLVESFSDVLPYIREVSDCKYHCNPDDVSNMCQNCLEENNRGKITSEKTVMKVIKVPISTTDDMLLGSIDVEKAVKIGEKAFKPGLLAEANQNILYIDEVNLLPDHITDSILDAAASGWNTVEREGISVSHPSRFILIGTMNPEEGELRPQILDRFGISVETDNIENPDLRTLILERNEVFTENPQPFRETYRTELENLREKITEARKNIRKINVPEEAYREIAETCANLNVDGFRPDIVSTQVAKALAALKGKPTIEDEEIKTALEYTLRHRTRSSGLVQPPSTSQIEKAYMKTKKSRFFLDVNLPELPRKASPIKIIEKIRRIKVDINLLTIILSILLVGAITYNLETLRSVVTKAPQTPRIIILEVLIGLLSTLLLNKLIKKTRKENEDTGILEFTEINIRIRGNLLKPNGATQKAGGSLQAKVVYEKDETNLDQGIKILQNLDSLSPFKKNVAPEFGKNLRISGTNKGRRTRVTSSSMRGKYTWYTIPKGRPKDIALIPTIRTAALNQIERHNKGLKSAIKPEDIKVKVREYYAPYSIILLVDMSLSMISSVNNIVETVYSLHKDVYRRRDRVGLIVFKGSKAYTLQHPTRNLDLLVKKLRSVGASDYTPLAAGLFQSWKTLKQEKLRNRDAIPYLYIISDGIANVPLETPISPLTRRRFNSEAQADSFDVAHLLRKQGIKVIIFNTNHSETEAGMYTSMKTNQRIRFTATQFLMHLAKITDGEYRGLKRRENI